MNMNAEASTSTSQHPTPIPSHAQPAGLGMASGTASPSPTHAQTHGFKTPALPMQHDGLRDPTTHPAFPPAGRSALGSSFPREASQSGIGGMFARPGGGSGSSAGSAQTVGNGSANGNGMGVGGGGGPMMGTWNAPQGQGEQQGGEGGQPSSGGAGGSASGSGPMAMSALSAMMRNNGTGSPVPPPQPQNSPNFPSQLSPYSQPFSLPQYGSIGGVPMSLGMSVGTSQMMGGMGMGMGMSISPHYPPGASFGNLGSYMQAQQNWPGQAGGGSVGGGGGGGPGSVGGPGWAGNWMRQRHESFGAGAAGAERSRELEAKYVRDFTCCGLKLGGLHDLLEHYEECHVHLAPDLKKHSLTLASMEPSSATTQVSHQPLIQHPAHPPPHNISQPAPPGGGQPSTSFPSVAPSPFAARAQPPQPPTPISATSMVGPGLTKQNTSSPADSDAPGTPGMMDIDMMDEDEDPAVSSAMQGQQASILPPTSAQWNSFQPPANVPQCVPPALLSYNLQGAGGPGAAGGITPNRFPTVNGFGFPGSGMAVGGIQPAPSRDRTPGAGGSNGFLTDAQKAERAARKAARKEAKRIAKENGEYRSSDEDEDGGKRKKYRCPVEGCNKAYKQANGLKYHLNRSINSSHGHLANMPIPPPT